MQQLIERLKRSWPARAWQRYSDERGSVLAQGMTLQAFLSLFAALFVAFAIFTAVLGGNLELRRAVIDSISSSVPGLLGEGGALDAQELFSVSISGWAGAAGAIAIMLTAIAWIAVSREGFRAMFELDSPPSNFLLLKLGDLAVAIGIGLLVVVSAGLLVLTQALAEFLGLGWTTQLIGFISQLVLDTSIVLLMFRFGGRLRLPAKRIVPAAIACAVAFAGLKAIASLLFRAVENNPLLGSVAAPVIILIWFGFIMQILLLALAFVAVTPTGRAYTRLVESGGIDARLTPEQAEALLQQMEAGRQPSLDAVGAHKRLSRRSR
ncbi:YihY/virulence factor BrkB family protein [Agrococcus sp. ProA11]|uniref:YihY/virulence factor BrkB family protein n=1 Tax=Agrococcus chionoecetis TaxID=3153752 RepID=UPI003261B40E